MYSISCMQYESRDAILLHMQTGMTVRWTVGCIQRFEILSFGYGSPKNL